MIKAKRLSIALICIFVSLVCLTSCNLHASSQLDNLTDRIHPYNQENDSSVRFYDELDMAAECESGIYYISNGFIYFYDFASGQAVIACNKPNCKHQAWTSETPEEQRCNAYQEDLIKTGFVCDGKLYIMVYSPFENTTNIICSDLDCSNQTIIATMNMDYCQQIVIKDGILYLPSNRFVYQVDESGFPEMSGQNQTCLCMVNLKTGYVKNLTELLTNYSGELTIISADNDFLYLNYSYFEEKFDGYNFEEAKPHSELYVYDFADSSYKRMKIEQESPLCAYLLVNNGKAISHERSSLDNLECSIVETDIKTGNRRFVGKGEGYAVVIGNKVQYKTETGTLVYNMDTCETVEIDSEAAHEFYIRTVTDNYLYGRRNGNSTLISISDYINSKADYVCLE